jgi:hypothetical protein
MGKCLIEKPALTDEQWAQFKAGKLAVNCKTEDDEKAFWKNAYADTRIIPPHGGMTHLVGAGIRTRFYMTWHTMAGI